MIRIKADLASIATASAAELHPLLQEAIELEHATIPPYLTALYSIKPGCNHAVATILRLVVKEEMLHLAIVANLLIALGAKPVLDKPGFIPIFPGPLPKGVQDDLIVGLEKLTRGLVEHMFMRIEEPEGSTQDDFFEPGVTSIGRFYEAIKARIVAIGDEAFTGDVDDQVVDPTWFPEEQLFAITDVDSAVSAIELIVRQGEGKSTDSPEDNRDPGHYREFKQIVVGRGVAWNDDDDDWDFTGCPIDLDPTGVWNLYPNAKIADYREGSRARLLAEQFNSGYTNLLRSLQATFNGHPQTLKAAMGLMQELHLTARSLVSTQVPGTGLHASPTFEYTPVHV